MEGILKTREINNNEIDAGSVLVYENKDELDVVTIMHLDSDGRWVYMGNNGEQAVPATAKLCSLEIVNKKGSYPLKFSQWSKAIKNKEVNTKVSFELLTPKFKEGKHINVCSSCQAHFLGSRRQPLCEKCSDENVTARIIMNKKVKPNKPRMITPEEAKDLLILAYDKGLAKTSSEDFYAWLKKQF